jgi:hypothetical protein
MVRQFALSIIVKMSHLCLLDALPTSPFCWLIQFDDGPTKLLIDNPNYNVLWLAQRTLMMGKPKIQMTCQLLLTLTGPTILTQG